MERKTILLCHGADSALAQLQDELQNQYADEVLCEHCAQIESLTDTAHFALLLVSGQFLQPLLTQKPLLCRRAGAIFVLHSAATDKSDYAGFPQVTHLSPPYNMPNLCALLRHHWCNYSPSAALTATDLTNLQHLFRIGTFNVDLASGVATWSKTVNQLFGLAADQQDIDFETFYARVHPEDKKALIRARQDALVGKAPLNLSHRVVHDDHIGWIWEYGDLIKDAEGNAIAFAGLVVDITQQRLLEEEVHLSTHYETLGQFVSGVAHNFNNLLTVILGNADDLLYKSGNDPDLGAQLQLILNAGQQGAKIVRDLQEFSQQQSIEPAGVDITELLERLGQILNISMGRNISIQYQLADSLWPALIDPLKLENALVGLTLNAKEAMQGVGEITISSSNVDDQTCIDNYPGVKPGQFVAVSITDHGCGIQPEDLSKVTMPFFTTHKEQRSGLGLALADRFLTCSGGHLLVASEPGKGTTVTVLIPVAEHVSTITGGRDSSEPAQILVLVTDAALRRNCSDSLLAKRYKVEEALSTVAALEALEKQSDIALVIIGDQDGIASLQMSKALPSLHEKLQLLLLPPAPTELASVSERITVIEDCTETENLVAQVERLLSKNGNSG
ncbi:MAG: ATP-binding protein [Gammaproteobacteria bacterium]